MPEGPEIRYILEICKLHLIGKTLEKIESNSKTEICLPKKSKVIDIKSKGKQLILIFEDYWFLIHFGLTGWLVFEKPNHPRYELHFNNIVAYLDDSRRLSKIKIYETENEYNKEIQKLGVDIFSDEFTEDFFIESFGKKKNLLVAFLMSQSKFCGIGNYIKNESLYLAGISPKRKTNELSNKEKSILYKKILVVAYSNFIENIESDNVVNKTIVDRTKIEHMHNIKLVIPYKFNVYGRDSTDLKGNKITIEDIGGRTCYYVKTLQL